MGESATKRQLKEAKGVGRMKTAKVGGGRGEGDP